MRTWAAVVVVVALLAELSFGLINVKLVADQAVLAPGQTTTIHILGQGTETGLYSLGGDIFASGTADMLAANVGSFAWVSEFNPVPLGNIIPRVGMPGSNGGWSSFGSMQTHWGGSEVDRSYGKASPVELASYTVTAQTVPGDVTLTFSGRNVEGFKPIETGWPPLTTIGTITPVTITVVPEPATLSLLALGGLLLARRRQV